MRADERHARVKRAFQDGHIDAEDGSDQRQELTGQREAARAEVERLSARMEEVGSS